MGIQMQRKKHRNLMLSLAYRIWRFLPLSNDRKLKFALDLSWIFSRFAHEQVYKTEMYKLDYGQDSFILKHITKDQSVLDIGCGKGYIIEKILPYTSNITGIDHNPDSLEIARKRANNDNVKLICDDVFVYLGKNPMIKPDLIILSHILEHLDEPLEFLKKLNGKAAFYYLEVPDFEYSHLNIFRKKVNTDLVYSDADHVFEFDRNEFEKLIEDANLKFISSEHRFGIMKYWCVDVN